MKKKIGIGVMAVIILASVIWKWRDSKEKSPEYRPVQVQRGEVRVTVLTTGQVEPQNRLEIKPPIGGRAEEILVLEGVWVNKGQILAWMSSTERAALLDAARAKGSQELAHWQDLYKPTPLVAPINGIIISRDVEPGQTVTAQDAVLVMSDRLIVKAQVDETDIGRIKLGLEAFLTLDAYPDERIKSIVKHVAFEAKTVNNVTIYEVNVVPEKVPDFMRSGMTANVTFLVAKRKGVLVIPAEAVHEDRDGAYVLVPGADPKQPEEKGVELGLSDGKQIELISGLNEGDAVLVADQNLKFSGKEEATNPFSPWNRPRRDRTRSQ